MSSLLAVHIQLTALQYCEAYMRAQQTTPRAHNSFGSRPLYIFTKTAAATTTTKTLSTSEENNQR